MHSFKDYFSESECKSSLDDFYKILGSSIQVFVFLQKLWIENFKQVGHEDLAARIFSFIGASKLLSNKETTKIILELLNDFHFKKQGRNYSKNKQKDSLNYALAQPYLAHALSFLDFGAGKLMFLNKVLSSNAHLKRLVGYDPKSAPDLSRFLDKSLIFTNQIKKLKELKPFDIVFSSFVFHHLTSEELNGALKVIRSVLGAKGRVLLVEEAFPASINQDLINLSQSKAKEVNYEVHNELNEMFEVLSIKDKFFAIFANDYLMNLKNLNYMPWTFGYKTLEGWQKLFEEYGFKLEEQNYFGFIKGGRIKQGIMSFQAYKLEN